MDIYSPTDREEACQTGDKTKKTPTHTHTQVQQAHTRTDVNINIWTHNTKLKKKMKNQFQHFEVAQLYTTHAIYYCSEMQQFLFIFTNFCYQTYNLKYSTYLYKSRKKSTIGAGNPISRICFTQRITLLRNKSAPTMMP